MATISFKTRPQKRFYSYNEKGTIYCISSTVPEIMAENGGVWNCYFQCEPYHMIAATEKNAAKYYQLYEKVGTNRYTAVTSTAFNVGREYYYFVNTSNYIDATAIKHTDDVYYSKNGSYSYSMPSDASELPQVSYVSNSTATVYYFDTLIGAGDEYENGTFKAMNRIPTLGTKESYGSLLADKVKDVISIYNFTSTVESIPDYLKKDNNDIDYTVPDLSLYGKVFLEKLNEEMVQTGESILAKYDDNVYKVTISQEVKDTVGTIESTKEKKNKD